MNQVHRRQLLIATASLLALSPPALAQQLVKPRRIGYLETATLSSSEAARLEFVEGLRELGYVEGRNLLIEWRFGDGSFKRSTELATELLSLNVEVILAAGGSGTNAARQLTSTIPIVSPTLNDPIGSGLVASYRRPESNVTGLSQVSSEVTAKHLELMMSVTPRLSRIAVLTNPEYASHPVLFDGVLEAAKKTKVTVTRMSARNPAEIERGFASISRERVQAVIILPDPLFGAQVKLIAGLALKYKLPSIWGGQPYPEAGGLMSYGFFGAESYRRAATFVDKILKGAKPGDLPIEQPTRLLLVINRNTAKALGITLTQDLLLRADRIID